jgi:hypothetical protein
MYTPPTTHGQTILPSSGSRPLAKEFVAGFLSSSIAGQGSGKITPPENHNANLKELEPALFIYYNRPR